MLYRRSYAFFQFSRNFAGCALRHRKSLIKLCPCVPCYFTTGRLKMVWVTEHDAEQVSVRKLFFVLFDNADLLIIWIIFYYKLITRGGCMRSFLEPCYNILRKRVSMFCFGVMSHRYENVKLWINSGGIASTAENSHLPPFLYHFTMNWTIWF